MSAHVEYTQGIIRIFDDGMSFDQADPFVSVIKLDKIGPDAVLLSADLARRKLLRKDLADIKQALIIGGFSLVYCWRRKGKKTGLGGKVIRTVGHLALWEIEL